MRQGPPLAWSLLLSPLKVEAGQTKALRQLPHPSRPLPAALLPQGISHQMRQEARR